MSQTFSAACKSPRIQFDFTINDDYTIDLFNLKEEDFSPEPEVQRLPNSHEIFELVQQQNEPAATVVAEHCLAFIQSTSVEELEYTGLVVTIKNFAIKCKSGFLAVQGKEYWFEDEPVGWALFTSENAARDVAEPHHSATGGFTIVPVVEKK